MFEITPDDIALLNDVQLRAVVARLCEAELRGIGQSPAHVTWGGNQNAPDGGIDVRVALPNGTITDAYIPRPATGYQVKQQDMPPGEVDAEMRPKGIIRPSIQELADQRGAYIIVSGQGSTSYTALTNRRDAMKAAIAGIPNADQLTLDFYDRTRVATWVRTHEGLIPWVRTLIGKSIPGWQSYGAWAHPHEGVTAEYLVDDQLRIHPPTKTDEKGLPALQGIQELRRTLNQAQHVVRLVGLSGVGKTRLVQALFDDRIGTNSLDPSLAIYTNMADDPDPQPVGLATDLVASGIRTVLVVDNCPADLHQRLSDVCRQPASKVSVITIEYDIREDQPEGTEVFTLEASSPELIEKIVRRRFPTISHIDARTIAAFSGGNARIAIALAATIEHNETIAGLTDDQLFQRLFQQRHAPDEDLYLTGQVCSLVYSFQGEDISNNQDAELVRLGNLIGRTPQELYRRIAELQRRDLVQARSVWRAVLPPAIANRLATSALENIPYAEIDKQLMTSARLMQSFSRRLGYLHTSKHAARIVKNWLAVGGLLGDVSRFNDLDRAMFRNVAPTAPEDALAALERTVQLSADAAREAKSYCDLLRSIAYDAALFERCTTVLVTILTSDDVNPRGHSTEAFVSLFYVIVSGTHATVEQRLRVIRTLVGSHDEKRRALGILALSAALEAWQFTPGGTFEFGARPRDYGYWPSTKEQAHEWFIAVLSLVEELGCTDAPTATAVRTALAERLRGLWLRTIAHHEIERVVLAIRQRGFWVEGWLAVRQILDTDGKGLDPEQIAALVRIEAALRPADLVQQVRGVVFPTRLQGVDLDDFEDHTSDDIMTRLRRTEALAKDLGASVAGDDAAFRELLPDLLANRGRVWNFGQGLAAGATNPEALFNRLAGAFANADEKTRQPGVLCGFLHELRETNPALTNTLLDRAMNDPTLGAFYPYLQAAVTIEPPDVARLKQSLTLGKAPATMYECLSRGRATDPIPPADLRDIVLTIAAMPSGYDVAIDLLYMRLFSDRDHSDKVAPEFVEAGGSLLQELSFSGKNDREDHRLGDLVRSCLRGPAGAVIATDLCARLKIAARRPDTSAGYHDDLLIGLLSVQPFAVLDTLCGGDQDSLAQGVRALRDASVRKPVLDVVSDDALIAWCDQEPALRYVGLAPIITVFERKDEKSPPRWKPLALRFLEQASDRVAVLRVFVDHIVPMEVWGAPPAAMSGVSDALLDQLDAFPDLATEVAQQKERIKAWIEEQRRRETAFDRERNERFE
jgi:hypothetical protein